MRALFDDTAVINHQHLVRLPNCTQPVGDDEGGTSGHQAQQRLLNLHLGAGVHAAGGLVQDENARVGQDGMAALR